MTEEEKKALRVINARTRRLLDELEIEKEDMSDEPKIAYLMQEIRANKTLLNLIEKLQKENEQLRTEVNSLKAENEELKNNKSIVEKILDKGKGFTLQQTQYIWEHYIPTQKVEDKIEEYREEIEQLRIERDVTYDSGIYKLEVKREALKELLERRKI